LNFRIKRIAVAQPIRSSGNLLFAVSMPMWQLRAAGKCFGGEKSVWAIKMASRFMMIDDDTLKDLLRIGDDLFQVCKWLNEKRDTATSSRLMPLVDELTHILIEAGKNNL